MMPWIILGIIAVGMAINVAIVLHWQRKDERKRRERERQKP